MIIINNINIDVKQKRLDINVVEDAVTKNVFIETNPQFVKFFVTDRADGILIGLLNYAMRKNHNIRCYLPISEDLYYNLTSILIPNLVKANQELHEILIDCPVISKPLEGFVAGTGISCGVDSLYALLSAQQSSLDKFKVTHLLCNNVGQHGEGEKAKKLYEKRIHRSRAFANEFSYELVECNTNLQELFPQNHFQSHTYTNLFPIISLGNLFRIYYYASSGFRYNEITLSSQAPGAYEPILLPILSYSGVNIYSGGVNVSRMDKLRAIINYTPSYKYLNVCFNENENCGICEKCVRTITALYALGELDKYNSVFNVSYFYSNKKRYLMQVYYYYKRKHHDYKEIYKLLCNEIGATIRVRVFARIVVEKIISLLYPLKEKYFPKYHLH